MFTRINTATLIGVEGYSVIVETDLHRGMPCFNIVGLADTTIKEACKRIRPAIMNSGFTFPNERVTVNLMPASKPKVGSHFDLPMALGIITLGWEDVSIDDTGFLGEVSLDGKINPVRGALPIAMSMRKKGLKNIVLPHGNAGEVSILRDMNIYPVESVNDAVDYIMGRKSIKKYHPVAVKHKDESREDFGQVVGQESAKRAIVVGAAGNHGILLVGGPGCGKTMMAKRIPSVLPTLTYEERLEITGIYSAAGLLSEDFSIVEDRPFRSPHTTISTVGLTGGGHFPRPGELSLAHRGVLFLDEMGEFDSKTIDAIRQPVEDGYIRINRNLDEIIFPAAVMIVAAANPCKCGYLWDERRICTCNQKQLDSHRRKLTGPFSDRIDMHIKVFPVEAKKIQNREETGAATTSWEMKNQVEKAMKIQRERYRGSGYKNNGSLDEEGIKHYCNIEKKAQRLLTNAYDRLNLSMRAYSKLLKVARTIADIEGLEAIGEEHVGEALAYRVSYWN